MTDVQSGAAPEALIGDFLGWLEGGPRAYEDVMEAWRTNCPRFTVWEDALEAGLARRVERCVELTDKGRAWLLAH